MNLFSPDFYGDGPDAYERPRKTGLARLWQLFTRDSLRLLGAGALTAVSSVAYAVGLMVSIDSHALLPMLITCPLGGMLAAPQLCGMADTILRGMRDDTAPWWATYRRAWKQNVRGTLLPGAAGGLLFGLQTFVLFHANRLSLDLFLLAAMLLGVAVAAAITTWLLPQLALMDLPLRRVLLNAVLLCVKHPLRTLAATVLQLVYWAFVVLAVPYSLLIFLLLNFWLPMLAAMMLLYDPLDDTFHIEEELDGAEDEP